MRDVPLHLAPHFSPLTSKACPGPVDNGVSIHAKRATLMNDTATNTAAGEYLSFTLGNEHYGVDILKVQEIRGYDSVTRVPDAPEYIKGVINLRGVIVPVIDLRLKLRMNQARYDASTVMIVLNMAQRVVGIVVDSVSDVIQLNAEHIRPKPEFGATVDTRFISGIGTQDERMLILLDIETLLDTADLGQNTVTQRAAA